MRQALQPRVLAAAAALPAAAVAVMDGRPAAAMTAVVLGTALAAGRAHPRPAWLVACVVLAATAPLRAASLLGAGADPAGELLLFALALAAAGDGDRRAALAAILAFTCLEEAMAVVAHDFPGFWPAPLAGGAAGLALRDRARVVDQLESQARELEAEREAYAALSVRHQRARIASELHDIVAHAISVMVVQASAGRRVADHDPDAADDALGVIADAAHEAEADLTRLVALLAHDDSAVPDESAGTSRIEALITRAAGSGLGVTLRLVGDCGAIDPTTAHVAFRVVQEALTNALRYAPGADVVVTLRRETDVFVVDVVNGPSVARERLEGLGGGGGLPGLRARLAAAGGTIEAGPTAARGWRVAARLPTVTAPVALV